MPGLRGLEPASPSSPGRVRPRTFVKRGAGNCVRCFHDAAVDAASHSQPPELDRRGSPSVPLTVQHVVTDLHVSQKILDSDSRAVPATAAGAKRAPSSSARPASSKPALNHDDAGDIRAVARHPDRAHGVANAVKARGRASRADRGRSQGSGRRPDSCGRVLGGVLDPVRLAATAAGQRRRQGELADLGTTLPNCLCSGPVL